MWIVKPFMHKEHAGLEGRTIDVGSVKVQIRNAIAEGGFSCVYLARDAVNPAKQYALKHMICADGESLELVMKEISVMKLLKGHPNVVTLVAHTIFDMGRTKEALLVMDFCEKSLVTVLENRGAGYFEEKHILLIFRDVCNAVFAMHGQSPPIAHRDLKAENVLLGIDGAWKLCDFGSTSTNHKRFEKPEEMGIEEDNIRKHTTPAYRSPEMWDLYRREVISEKVDIWALGCLLYRICYFKSAFDGESKLQILNGNYRIPDLPKYSASMMGLIKDMLEASPDARPDITQVWFRVNELLPVELQKHLPDGSGSASAVGMQSHASNVHDEGAPNRSTVMPRRNPPPPPSSRDSDKETQHSGPPQATSKVGGGGGPVGAFWSTQHANDSVVAEDKGPVFDEEPINQLASKHSHKSLETRCSPPRESVVQLNTTHGKSMRFVDGSTDDFEIRFFPANSERGPEKTKEHPESKTAFQNEAFNTFVAEFNTGKLSSNTRPENEALEAEVTGLKEQLKQANLEKAEIASKYEKLSAICRCQRQEIQELKRALAAVTPSPSPPLSKDIFKSQTSAASPQSETPPREKIEGTVWELQRGMFASSPATPSPDPKPWQAFAEEPKAETAPISSHPKSVRTINGHRRTANPSASTTANDTWGFGQDSFTAVSGGPQISRASDQGTSSQRFGGETKKVEPKQPAGWAGF